MNNIKIIYFCVEITSNIEESPGLIIPIAAIICGFPAAVPNSQLEFG